MHESAILLLCHVKICNLSWWSVDPFFCVIRKFSDNLWTACPSTLSLQNHTNLLGQNKAQGLCCNYKATGFVKVTERMCCTMEFQKVYPKKEVPIEYGKSIIWQLFAKNDKWQIPFFLWECTFWHLLTAMSFGRFQHGTQLLWTLHKINSCSSRRRRMSVLLYLQEAQYLTLYSYLISIYVYSYWTLLAEMS